MKPREEQIERVVAVVSTILVVLVFCFSSGLGLLEGMIAYAAVGAAVWLAARKTFWSRAANRCR